MFFAVGVATLSFGFATAGASFAAGVVATALAFGHDGLLDSAVRRGILGALLLWRTLATSPLYNRVTTGLGTDGWGSASHIRIGLGGALIAEVVLSAFFVFIILGVTTNTANTATAGVVIGLSLTVVHLIGIPITRTSVNPARSLGLALIVGGTALHQVWLFIVTPLLGGIVAAVLHRGLSPTSAEASA